MEASQKGTITLRDFLRKKKKFGAKNTQNKKLL